MDVRGVRAPRLYHYELNSSSVVSQLEMLGLINLIDIIDPTLAESLYILNHRSVDSYSNYTLSNLLPELQACQ